MRDRGEMHKITVLGATGSIGQSTADVIVQHRDRFEISALVAGSDANALAAMARRLGARFAALADGSKLAAAPSGTGKIVCKSWCVTLPTASAFFHPYSSSAPRFQ